MMPSSIEVCNNLYFNEKGTANSEMVAMEVYREERRNESPSEERRNQSPIIMENMARWK